MNMHAAITAASVVMIFLSGGLHAAAPGSSISYERMQSRAATVNSVDAAYHNPAGLTRIKDGLYLEAGNRIMTKTVALKVWGGNGEENTPSYLVPEFAAAYKTGRGALFLTLSTPEGVESHYYDRPASGMPLLAHYGLNLDAIKTDLLKKMQMTSPLLGLELPLVNYIKTRGYWLQGRLGGSFSIVDALSLTGGVMGSYYSYEQSAGVKHGGTVEKTGRNALGWSGFFGFMITASSKAALGVFYSTEVIARGKETDRKFNYTRVMEKRRPHSLSIGINLLSGERGSVQLSYQVDFTGEAGFGTKNILTRDHEIGYLDWAYIYYNATSLSLLPFVASGNAQNYKHRHRHTFGLGIEIEVEGIMPSIGLSFATAEKYPRSQNPLEPDLPRLGIGAGVRVRVSESISMETGSANYFYLTGRTLYSTIKMNKSLWTWGISATIKAL